MQMTLIRNKLRSAHNLLERFTKEWIANPSLGVDIYDICSSIDILEGDKLSEFSKLILLDSSDAEYKSQILVKTLSLHHLVLMSLLIVEQFAPDNDKYLISVKLPPEISLDELSKFYRRLDRIIGKPLQYMKFAEIVQINSFENGSKINDFFVRNKETVAFVISLLTLATTLYTSGIKPYKEFTDNFCKYDESIKYDETVIAKMIDEKTKELLFEYAEQKSSSVNETELSKSIVESFQNYITIVESGATINVYINSSDESDKDLLPVQDELNSLIEKQTALIEQSSERLLLKMSTDESEEDTE